MYCRMCLVGHFEMAYVTDFILVCGGETFRFFFILYFTSFEKKLDHKINHTARETGFVDPLMLGVCILILNEVWLAVKAIMILFKTI